MAECNNSFRSSPSARRFNPSDASILLTRSLFNRSTVVANSALRWRPAIRNDAAADFIVDVNNQLLMPIDSVYVTVARVFGRRAAATTRAGGAPGPEQLRPGSHSVVLRKKGLGACAFSESTPSSMTRRPPW